MKLGFPAASDANIAEELGLKLDPSGRFAPDQWIDATSFMRLVHVAQARHRLLFIRWPWSRLCLVLMWQVVSPAPRTA